MIRMKLIIDLQVLKIKGRMWETEAEKAMRMEDQFKCNKFFKMLIMKESKGSNTSKVLMNKGLNNQIGNLNNKEAKE